MTDRSNTDPPTYADDSDKVDGKDASQIEFSGDHRDLTNVSTGQHHTRYADSEARAAIEAGNLSHVQGANGFRFDFNNSTNWVELVDTGTTNNSRTDLVLNRVHLSAGTGWFTGGHSELTGVSSNDHHAKPTSTQVNSSSGGWTTLGYNWSDGDTTTSFSVETDGDDVDDWHVLGSNLNIARPWEGLKFHYSADNGQTMQAIRITTTSGDVYEKSSNNWSQNTWYTLNPTWTYDGIDKVEVAENDATYTSTFMVNEIQPRFLGTGEHSHSI